MTYEPKDLTFSDILQKGLGRAFDWVAKTDKLEIRKDLLNACLHDLRYDSQCESGRASWLYELICKTGDRNFYRDRIFQALSETDEFWDLDQLYDLVLIWAKEGNKKAREILYSTFRQQNFNESWLGGEQIIELDGINGLLAVAEIVGARILNEPELWEDDELIKQASENSQPSLVWSELERKAINNIKIKAYLNAVKSQQKNDLLIKKNRQKNQNKVISLDLVLEIIDNKANHFYLLSKYGRQLKEDEIERVFNLLLEENRERQLVKYLYIFRNRAFPRLASRLFDLAVSDNKKIQSAAIAALANNTDPSIHDLAVLLIETDPQSISNRALKLLINNYQTQDFALIESILSKYHDIDNRHHLGMDLIEIIDKHKTTGLISYAWWIYEQTPCAYCRHSILEILFSRKQVPSKIREECLLDCSSEIQTLAKVN